MDISPHQSGGQAGDNENTNTGQSLGQRSEYLRNKAIVRAVSEGESVAHAAERYGVSRQWVYELVRRWRAKGDAGLLPRSRAAHTIANRTDSATRQRIVELRVRLTGDGLDAGAESIAARLEREGVTPPANSTIHRILVDSGLVRPEPGKRPKGSYVRFEAELPNETWQSDFTHWLIADGSDALIVSWLDDHSRCLLYVRAFDQVSMRTVEDSFLETCGRYGIPASTLTDNGTVYTTRLVSAEKGHFERTLALMGVRQKNGRPYHPQTQGKIERYHRTLKQWLTAQPLATSIEELNGQLAEFQRIYNEQRPHRALNRRTPGEIYRAKGKALPDPELAARTQERIDQEQAGQAQQAAKPRHRQTPRTAAKPEDVTIPPKTHRIDGRGCITQDNIAGMRRVFNVGKHHAGGTAELLIENGRAIITDMATGEILADQTLDTTRNYQYRIPVNHDNHAPGQM